MQASAGNSPSGRDRTLSIKPLLSANDVDSVQSDISTKIGYLTMDPKSGLAGGLNQMQIVEEEALSSGRQSA